MGATLHHATTIAGFGRGLLICGPAGSGKSAVALELMAYGARLVADDQTVLQAVGDRLIARAPEPIAGRIEARGLGLLRADALPEVPIAAVLDLTRDEDQRLPPQRRTEIEGISLALLYRPTTPVAPALWQYLRAGRAD